MINQHPNYNPVSNNNDVSGTNLIAQQIEMSPSQNLNYPPPSPTSYPPSYPPTYPPNYPPPSYPPSSYPPSSYPPSYPPSSYPPPPSHYPPPTYTNYNNDSNKHEGMGGMPGGMGGGMVGGMGGGVAGVGGGMMAGGMPIPIGRPVVGVHMPKTGFEKLMVPGIFVKQKMEWLEIFTGCETENKYTVYATDVAGNKEGFPLFKCREKSGCLNRNLFPGDCREFKMEVTNESNGLFPNEGQMFLTMKRPFKCTLLCLNRPHIEVTHVEGGQQTYLGKVVHDFSCCEMIFSIYNKKEECRYIIRETICQIGVYNKGQGGCGCCKSCQQAFLFIYDVQNGHNKVGIIEKRGRGFTELISDADNFSLLFPIKATLEERVLLMAATLLLDFRYFEQKSGNNRGRYNGQYGYGY